MKDNARASLYSTATILPNTTRLYCQFLRINCKSLRLDRAILQACLCLFNRRDARSFHW